MPVPSHHLQWLSKTHFHFSTNFLSRLMGCISSTPNVHPSDPVTETAVGTPYTSISKPYLATFDLKTRSRRRKSSIHQSMYHEDERNSHPRRKSAPESPPHPSSSSSHRMRHHTFQGDPSRTGHTVPGLPNPGVDDLWLGYGLLMTSLSISAVKGWDSITHFNDASSTLQSPQVCGPRCGI